MTYRMGFIGIGNMGGALLSAACRSVDAEDIAVYDIDEKKVSDQSNALGCRPCSLQKLITESDYVVLGVKPQYMASMLAEAKPYLENRKSGFCLVTMAAGISTGEIQNMAGSAYPVIRIMPNTATRVNEGMLLYCHTENVTKDMLDGFLGGMQAAGKFDALPEKLIDAGTAISGCGPAYVYLMAEAMADGAVSCGIPRDKAMAYAAQTLLGAAKMIQETGKHPGQLKDEVCSPGGSTIAGVHALEEHGFRGAVMDAVLAAYDKTCALGK